jgi:prephenate dehydrogenase
MIDRVLILGTGLLGTSTGLALRAAGFEGQIVGWNRGPEQAKIALELGAIDSISSDAVEAARSSQLILLATPVYAILDWMERLAGVLDQDHLVTDVGSTKSAITAAGNRLFNQPATESNRAGFLAGHPMAGKEISGAIAADPAIFGGAVWLFTSEQNQPPLQPEAAQLAAEWRNWVQKIGCRILDLDAARHDELVAWVSHLPQFLSTALTALLQDEIGNAPELTAVGGRALREMTRLGSSPYSMWRDVAYTNTDAIATAIHALEQRLAHLRENLRTPELRDEFELANRFRKS